MSTANTYPPPGVKPEYHPYANIFPLLEGDKLAELADDIKANGQREAIVLFEGKVLDGRNRLEACFLKKLEPFYRFYEPRADGKSPLSYAISRNLKRRQLTLSQAAIVAAEALPLYEAEAKLRQAASGKAHSVNLKTAATPAPAASPAAEPAAQPQEAEEKHGVPALDFDRGVDVLDTDGKVSVTVLKERFSWPHAKAKAVVDALCKAGKCTVDVTNAGIFHAPPDEFDQRPKHGGGGGKTPAPAKPSKTVAGAIAAATAAAAAAKTPPKPKAAGSAKPAPAEKPTPPPATASEAAGKAVGVSGRSVRAAKALLAADPEKAAEVKAGSKKLGTAVKEAKKEAMLHENEISIGRIRQICGKALADAIAEGTRLTKKGEIEEYAKLPDDEMLRLRSLIDQGWDLAKAQKYKAGALARTHRIGDLLDRAAAQGGTFTLDIDGWAVTVTKQPSAK